MLATWTFASGQTELEEIMLKEQRQEFKYILRLSLTWTQVTKESIILLLGSLYNRVVSSWEPVWIWEEGRKDQKTSQGFLPNLCSLYSADELEQGDAGGVWVI